MLGAELSAHLGHEPGDKPPEAQSNRRNGVSRKTVKSGDGAVEIAVPRDRDGGFEPELIGKGPERIHRVSDIPHAIEFLADNGSLHTAKETRIFATQLGLTPCFTPVASPESNGVAFAGFSNQWRSPAHPSSRPSSAIMCA